MDGQGSTPILILQNFWEYLDQLNTVNSVLISVLITVLGTGLLYLFLCYVLRPIFRNFEGDIALVTLNVSIYPIVIIFGILTLKLAFAELVDTNILPELEKILTAVIIVVLSSWSNQLFTQVFIYYLQGYTKQSEVMWDDVLLPILSAIVPVIIFITGGGFVLGAFGVDLSGIWVTLGGITFVLGFALQDILANFFSGIVLLIDTPFRFGDILRLEDGSIGMLRQIGIRVTQLYIFSDHCDVYIPNSALQQQKITNLSRPTSFYYLTITVKVPPECELEECKKLVLEIVLAHPDTLGDIDGKLEVFDNYYNSEDSTSLLLEQQEIGKLRLIAEQEVNFKLDEIDQGLEALIVTMQFASKGGIKQEEIENLQQEYQEILSLMGFQVVEEINNRSVVNNFEENTEDGLIELIRRWYRHWLRDPNLLDEDQYFISDEWERKITLLKRRAQRLFQRIANPQAEETRLDDYVMELKEWLKDKLKVSREKWQEPQIRMVEMSNAEALFFLELNLSFFVDDVKLENGRRGERVRSQIYQEIFRHLKPTYLIWNGSQGEEAEAENGQVIDDASLNLPPVNNSFVQTGLDPATAKQGFAFYLSVGKNKPAAK